MIDKAKIKNILAIRNDRFGEFLLNIPALRALKETFPQAKLALAVNPTVKELAGAIDCVDEVLLWDEVRGDLKKFKFDLCVVLNPSKEAHLKSFLAGIPERVGYDRKWGFLLTHKMKDTKELGNRHEVECNLALVGLIGAVTENKSLAIKINKDLFPEFAGKKIVAIHPFTSDPVKQWPVERFRELAQRITEDRGQSPAGTVPSKVVFVGKTEWGKSPFGESPHSGTVSSEAVQGYIINMVNKTTLLELAALLKRCSLVVSCDSGPVHLAAAVGTPVIALFRNDLVGKTAKRWGPWGEGHTVIEKVSLNDLSVEEVFGKIKGLLHSSSTGAQ